MTTMLGAAQRRFFDDNGFVVVEGFFTDQELAAATDAFEQVWDESPRDVTVDIASGQRLRASDVPRDTDRASMKVNDLYLTDAGLREAVMSARLNAILTELMADDPVCINTLSVECGTQQTDHLDTLFMTPRTPGKLLASWMALEDAEADAGPLRYYPESNHIEPFRFRDGGYHVDAGEMDQWSDYMAGEVERHGLAETRFLARRGDLLIWDAWLLHGGSEIATPGRTRSSVITHYHAKTDARHMDAEIVDMPGGGRWLRRPPHVPVDSIAAEPHHDEPTAPAELPAVKEPAPLRERLDQLDPEHH